MRRSRSNGRSLAAALLLGAFLVPSTLYRTPAQAGDRTLLLAVELNGRALDVMVEAQEHDGAIGVQPGDLPAIGLRAPPGTAATVALSSLPGVSVRLDERRQTLVVQAGDRALAAQKLDPTPAGPVRPESGLSGYGGVLNYDLLGWAGSGNVSGVNGLFDLHAHSPFGVAGAGLLVRQGWGAGGTSAPAVRLDTVLTHTEADTLRRWRVGDVITGSLSWTRPFRLGGGQVTTDFSIRPDLVTFPVPELAGQAGVPSTVDVLVNGVRQLSQTVQPGPFELRQTPVVTGAGDIAVVVRDATGRETVRNLSFYASPVLLKQGLWSYGLEGGLVRTGFGTLSNGYTRPAVVATARYGVTDWLTAEGHAEGGGGVQMAGAGLAADLGGQALLSAAGAGSRAGRRNGGQVALGIERVGRVVSVSAAVTRASRGFRDVVALNGTPVPTQTLRLGASVSLGWWGSLQGAYVAANQGVLVQPGATANGLVAARATGASRARILSVSFNRRVTDTVAFYATGYRDFAPGGTAGFNAGFSIALGSRRSADAAGGVQSGRPAGSVAAAQVAVEPGDVGWRVGATRDGVAQQQAEIGTVLPWGTASLAGEHVGRAVNGRVGAQGSLVLGQGGVFAANRVEDSYAVVDTDGIAGVGVLRENRPVGRTDSSGHLLIPDLRGWDSNTIAIDPATLPADAGVQVVQQVVRPADHSGVPVRFAAKRGRAAIVHLVDGAGKPVPPGSSATVPRTGRRVPVGHGGEVFLDDLDPVERLQVNGPAGPCEATLHFTATPGDIPEIGPVACERTPR